jgi:hypothetical protein
VESSVAAEDMWRAAAANRSPLDMQCVGIITVREHRTLLANAVDSRTLLPTSIDRRRAVGDECFVYCTDSNKARPSAQVLRPPSVVVISSSHPCPRARAATRAATHTHTDPRCVEMVVF